jgi:hypothetical protein
MGLYDTHLVTKNSSGTKRLSQSPFKFRKLSDVLPSLFKASDSGSGLGIQKVARGFYDFSVSGGAIGSYSLLPSDQLIPDKAIITQVYIDIITGMTSTGGTGTIALTANSAGDLLVAVDADTLSGVTSGVPVGTAATMVKCTADRNIVLAIATAALTAGKIAVFVEYVISA